jgi:hypothetical protein
LRRLLFRGDDDACDDDTGNEENVRDSFDNDLISIGGGGGFCCNFVILDFGLRDGDVLFTGEE